MTEEEKRKFWEKCGFKFAENRDGYTFNTVYPNGEKSHDWGLPDFTLDNLFKYAVPALNKKFDRHINLYQSTNGWVCNIGLGDIEVEDRDPAIALRDALWQVLKEEIK